MALLKNRVRWQRNQAPTRGQLSLSFEWRQICAKIECIYDGLLAGATEAAST